MPQSYRPGRRMRSGGSAVRRTLGCSGASSSTTTWSPTGWTATPGRRNPPEVRDRRINRDWPHLFSRDVLSVPDKWEYPAFFAWDLAFHMVPLARIDPKFAKDQLLLLLREWYLHPSGQLPAFEYDLSNVNPPVHAWACWQVYRADGKRDVAFLERAFQKLLMNFTWWVNRKDPHGRGVFGGGFLGMDNLGVFDRSRPLPVGQELEQADGTAWMGLYCTQMLEIALELALRNRVYEDVATKFHEHFVRIADALNNLGGARTLGRGGRVLLRPTPRRRPVRSAEAPRADGDHSPLGRPHLRRARDPRKRAGV